MKHQYSFLLLTALCTAACGELHKGPVDYGTDLIPIDMGANSPGGAVSGEGGKETPGGTPQPGNPGGPKRTDWLTIKGNKFYREGKVWTGRGVTIHDTRSCDFCTARKPNVN